jgi:hypothetical protein
MRGHRQERRSAADLGDRKERSLILAAAAIESR